MRDPEVSAPAWMKRVLQMAALYNLVWGAFVIAAPSLLFRWAGMEQPRYPQIWQCVGMIVGVYGVGYWLAARDPFRHWPIVLVGFLGKVFGPIGFLQAGIAGSLPWSWGATIITNDLIWWGPFATILYCAFRHNTDTSRGVASRRSDQAMQEICSHRNSSLLEISTKTPTLLVFVRHRGCTFCRKTLSELASQQRVIEQLGATIAVVHMGSPMEGTLLLEEYGLGGVHRFSDPACILYRVFGLRRGSFHQLFSPRVIVRGIQALSQGHGIGGLRGDGFRMPGTFSLIDGRIVEAHRPGSASDIPDFSAMARRASRCWRERRALRKGLATTEAPISVG